MPASTGTIATHPEHRWTCQYPEQRLTTIDWLKRQISKFKPLLRIFETVFIVQLNVNVDESGAAQSGSIVYGGRDTIRFSSKVETIG